MKKAKNNWEQNVRKKQTRKNYALWVAVYRNVPLELFIYRWISFHNFISNSLKNHDLFCYYPFFNVTFFKISKAIFTTSRPEVVRWIPLGANKMLIKKQKSWLFFLHPCCYPLLDWLLSALFLYYLDSQEFSNTKRIILTEEEEEEKGVLYACENLCSLLPVSELEQFSFEEVIYTHTSITYNLLCSVNSLFDLWRVEQIREGLHTEVSLTASLLTWHDSCFCIWIL